MLFKKTWLALYLSLKSTNYDFYILLFTVHASMDSTWHFWSVTGVTGRVNIDALQRLSRRLTTWQKRQWDIHWKHGEQSVHVQLSVAGNEYLYMKRSEHGCALFLPCHCNPLKKLKLLEMSQSKFLWAKKSPALHITCHIIYIWKYNGQVGFRIH